MNRSIELGHKNDIQMLPAVRRRRVTTKLTLEPGSQAYHWVTDRSSRRRKR